MVGEGLKKGSKHNHVGNQNIPNKVLGKSNTLFITHDGHYKNNQTKKKTWCFKRKGATILMDSLWERIDSAIRTDGIQ